MVVGRSMWLFNMRHLLSDRGAAKLLHEQRWSIVEPSAGLTWFTSDDPVIRLSHKGEGKYDFSGGITSKGTEILLPLSPRHLLYARVGYRPPPRGQILARADTEKIRGIIAQHAFRTIFAGSPEEDVVRLRPRIVSEVQFRVEHEKWRKWHLEQVEAESGLTSSGGS